MLVEIKVKTARLIDAKTRKVSETYLVETDFFSKAEYAVTEYLAKEQKLGLISDFEIQSLKISSVKEIAEQYEGEYSFLATLMDVWTEDDGTEKHLKYKMLLWADDLTQANQRVQALSKQGYDMMIEGIKQVNYQFLQ